MKITFSVLALALLGLVAGGCNRHSWEDTKVLYKEHDTHGSEEKHADGEKKEAAHP